MIKFYGYKKCSTCRKAQKFLESKSIKYKDIDITEKAPSKLELKRMLQSYDGQIGKLFNTSGVIYREMKLSSKIKTMSSKEAIDLLASDGRLVKRPFVLGEKTCIVGFKEDEWSGLI